MDWPIFRRSRLAHVVQAMQEVEKELGRLPARLGVTPAALGRLLYPLGVDIAVAKRGLQRASQQDETGIELELVSAVVASGRRGVATLQRRLRPRAQPGVVTASPVAALNRALSRLERAASAWRQERRAGREGMDLAVEVHRCLAKLRPELAKTTSLDQLEAWYGDLDDFGWEEQGIAARVARCYALDSEPFQSWELRRRSRAAGRSLVYVTQHTSLAELLKQRSGLAAGSYVIAAKLPRWRVVWVLTTRG